MKVKLILFLVVLTNSVLCQTSEGVIDAMGLKQGDWVYVRSDSIDANKKLTTYCYYVNDTLNGVMSGYLDEKLLYSVNYINGVKNGIERIYYRKSDGYKKLNFYENGHKVYSIIFYTNGRIYEEGGYKEGKKHGRFVEYYKSGQIFLVTNYNMGKMSSDEYYYKKNGKIDVIFHVEDGIYTGETSK